MSYLFATYETGTRRHNARVQAASFRARVTSDDDTWRYEIPLPGLRREDLRVSLDGRVLTLRADQDDEQE